MRQLFTFFHSCRVLFLSGLFMLLGMLVIAQPAVEWVQAYGGSFGDTPRTALATADGGYLIGGLTLSTNDDINNSFGKGDGWIIKVDAAGTLLWSVNYGDTGQDEIKKIVAANDGGYIIAGYKTDGVATTSDFWIFKINEAGNIVWEKTFGGAGFDTGTDLIATQDGYLLLGHSDSPDFVRNGYRGQTDAVLLKLNNAGNQIWGRRWGGAQNDFTTAIHRLANGRIIVSGYADSNYNNHHGAQDGWLTLLNPNGQPIWSRFFGGTLDDKLFSVTSNNGMIYASGFSYSNNQNLTVNNGLKDGWLIQVDATGNLQWSINRGGAGHESFNHLAIQNNQLIVGGYTWSESGGTSQPLGQQDFWLLNYGFDGTEIWETNFGGDRSESITSFAPTTDGSLLLIGPTHTKFNGQVAQNNGMEDFLIIKLEGNDNAALSVSLGNDQFICEGGATSLNPTITNCTSCSIVWSDGTGSINRTVSPTMTTTYSISISDGNGQTSTDQVTVFVNTLPELMVGISTTDFCPGDFVTLTAETENCPDCAFDWNDDNVQSTRTIQVDNDASYSLTITNADGCTASQAVLLNVSENIEFMADVVGISCAGDSDGSINLLDLSSPAINFQWSNGASGSSINNLPPGNYTVEASGNGLCATSAIYLIEEKAPLALNQTITQVACFNGNNGSIAITVNGGTTPYQYNWSNGRTTPSPGNLTAGTYSLTITDQNNCTLTESFTITHPSAILVNSMITRISCNGAQDGGILLNPGGGSGGYTFNWANGNTTNQLNNIGSGSYSVAVTDSDGCSTTASFLIEDPLAIDFNVSAIVPTNGNNGSILAVPFGGTPPYSLLWNTGSTSFQIANLTADVYTVRVTDSEGCMGEETIFLGVTSSRDLELVTNFEVWPNPNQGQMEVLLELAASEHFSLSLIATTGQKIWEQSYTAIQIKEPLDFSGLPAGVYFLQYRGKNGVKVKRVMITN